jgi:cell division protease FtsH
LLNPYLKKLQNQCDTEISLLIEGQYQRAIEILEENRQIESTGRYTIEEVIFKDDLETIF